MTDGMTVGGCFDLTPQSPNPDQTIKHNRENRVEKWANHTYTVSNAAVIASLLLGIGLGGFLDGIVLHQMLQWHNMVSHQLPPVTMENMRINMFWDGAFHLFTWSMSLAGLALLWCGAKRGDALPSTLAFIGLMINGFGLFNLIEGVISHHLLELHHVREIADPLAWDLGFLAIGGVGMILLGLILTRAGRGASVAFDQSTFVDARRVNQ